MQLSTWILRHLSINRMVVLSVVFTFLPMLAGLVSAFFAVGQLSALSQHAVHHVAEEAKDGQVLLDHLSDLERRGKRYLAVRDANAYSDFNLSHERFTAHVRQLAAQANTDNAPLMERLEFIAKAEQAAFAAVGSEYPVLQAKPTRSAHAQPERVAPSVALPPDFFQAVRASARDLSLGYAAHIEEEAKTLANLTQDIKRKLIIYIALLFSVSGMVMLGSVFLLHNPIRQLDFYIRALGAGNFTQPIKVVGTGDVVFLGERLEWLRNHLIDLEKAKQRFVRNVSHEIKTPLATIHEGAELLVDEVVGELNQEQKDIAVIMVNNADRMDKMIAEFINYSQVGARGAYPRFSPVDMREVVQGLLADYRLQFEGRSLTLDVALAPVRLLGDKDQLRSMVDNLLSNAVKYSPVNGEIRLTLAPVGGHMVLEIEDDGPGIDPDERDKVFEPFFQGRSSRQLHIKGTGFGLAIVAECVALHHGTVEALASRDDRAGARIRVRLPMQSVNYQHSVNAGEGSIDL